MTEPTPRTAPFNLDLIRRFNDLLARVPEWLVALAARVALAGVFWTSARTKLATLGLLD